MALETAYTADDDPSGSSRRTVTLDPIDEGVFDEVAETLEESGGDFEIPAFEEDGGENSFEGLFDLEISADFVGYDPTVDADDGDGIVRDDSWREGDETTDGRTLTEIGKRINAHFREEIWDKFGEDARITVTNGKRGRAGRDEREIHRYVRFYVSHGESNTRKLIKWSVEADLLTQSEAEQLADDMGVEVDV